ncbi:MAG: hypothetical protein WBB47_00970 [Paenisporosarcina sp.]
MVKKFSKIVILIVTIGGVIIYLYMKEWKTSGSLDAIETIEMNYMTYDGLIKSYSITDKPEYLVESTGLYMELLLQQKRETHFRDQVEVLKEYFIVRVEDDYFIKWKTGLDISVNAFIDDLRIVNILLQAAVIFHNEEYATLANELLATVKKHQIVNGQIAHYYDWESNYLAPTMVNSYLHDDYLSLLKIDKFPTPSDVGVFFAEEQMIKSDKSISSDEAHMVDQLLIATYCLGKSCENRSFDKWLKKQWEQEKTIYGRYNKENRKATVKYESRAVYALAVRYFKKNHSPLAHEIIIEKSSFFSTRTDKKTHFFDYVHGVIVSNEN